MKILLAFIAATGLFSITCFPQTYSSNWHPLGPVNMPSYEPSMGLVNCITAPAGNTNKLYLGSAGGGVWSSDDGGATWLPRSDFLPVLGVSSIVIDSANPNTIYLATGDADGGDTPSIGVWKSTDGGTNWTPTGLSWPISPYVFNRIFKLTIHPNDSQRIFAATSDGIYTTYNGGTNWQRTTPGGNTYWYDIQFQPGSSSVMYLTGLGANFFRSTDTGTNWTQITAGLPTSGVYRSALAVSAANPLGVYLMYCASDYGYYGLYQSLNDGSNFTVRSSTSGPDFYFGHQGYYDLTVTVSPTDFNEVYLGAGTIGKSTDGGTTWQSAQAGTQSGYTHVDVHTLTFLNGALFAGTDGGAHKTLDGAANWQDLSASLQIAQINQIGGAQQDSSLIYVGEQDNGLNRFANGSWSRVRAGDYSQPIVDPMDQNTVYAVFNGAFYKTTDGWSSSAQLQITTSESAIRLAPLVISPSDRQTLFAGFQNVWETTNGGGGWFAISSFSDGKKCSSITLAPSNPNNIYVVRSGGLWRTSNGGANWTNVSAGIPGSVMTVAVSSSDPNIIWVAQNDNNTTNKIYASTNGGANWTAYTGSLPNRRVNCLVYQGGSNDGLYAGFEAGVYYRDAGMADWQPFLSNLPNASVRDLQIHYGSLKLRAATYGRGLWESYLAGAKVLSLSGNLAFGDVTAGSSAQNTLTINNEGNTTLTVSSISYPSGFSGDWSSGTIPEGGSKSVTVTFSPTSTTTYGGTVTVNANATSGVNTIEASGTGVPNYVSVTVQANPSGRAFTVDGTAYTTAQSFSWVSSSIHTIATTAQQSGGAVVQFIWSNWSDGGVLSHTVSPSGNTSYTASFTTQYYLTMNAGIGGTVNPVSGWYDSGSSVLITSSTNSCYNFGGWTRTGFGSYSGTNNPASVTMGSALIQKANFSQITYLISTTNSPSAGGSTIGGGIFTCGANVTVTAKIHSGFRFANWTEAGTVVGLATNYSFIASGNRTLVANFSDLVKPTFTIAAPTAGQRWSNSLFTVSGTARDNIAVSNVWYQLNGGSWTPANTANNWSNWTAAVTLTPGTNVVLAFVQDTSGNLSLTSRVAFVYIPGDRLYVLTSGVGNVSPNYSNVWLRIGNTYKLTATPGAGFVFSNWMGGAFAATDELTNTSKLTFTMSSNLVLQANFVPNPFPAVAGNYQGLFFDTNNPSQENAGFFNATVTGNGKFTAKLQRGSKKPSISGQFSVGGAWFTNKLGISSNPASAWLQLDLSGGEVLTGQLSNSVVTAELLANRAVFNKTNPAPQAGKYTLIIPGSTDAVNQPGGNGYGTVSVSTNGAVTFAGRLSDTTNASQGTFVSQQGWWPFYISLYANNGSIFGWLVFTNETDRDIDGVVNWIKPPQPGAPFYPAGFTLTNTDGVEVIGSRFSSTKGVRALSLTNGVLILENGNLPQSFTNGFTLTTNNVASGTNMLTFTITNATGLFRGSVTNPSAARLLKISGAVFQKQNAGYGQFPGTNQTGSLFIGPE